MLRRLALVAVLAVAALLPQPSFASGVHSRAAAVVAYGQIPMFATEQAAQAHCPADVVVWLNTNSGIWHEKGMRWYGRTKHGAYVCRREAAAAGYPRHRKWPVRGMGAFYRFLSYNSFGVKVMRTGSQVSGRGTF